MLARSQAAAVIRRRVHTPIAGKLTLLIAHVRQPRVVQMVRKHVTFGANAIAMAQQSVIAIVMRARSLMMINRVVREPVQVALTPSVHVASHVALVRAR